MRIRNRLASFAVVVLLLVACFSASAEKYQFANGNVTCEVERRLGENTEYVQTNFMNILARRTDDQGKIWYLVNLNEDHIDDGYVSGKEMKEKLNGKVDLSDIPDEGALPYETVRKGNKKEAIKGIQQILIDLGYLSGKADGTYGGQTEKAVSAFEGDTHTLSPDGIADPVMQLLAFSITDPSVVTVIKGVGKLPSPEERFEKIWNRVDGVNLSAFAGSQYSFIYDDFEDTGEITVENGEETIEVDGAQFTVKVALAVNDQEQYGLSIVPHMTVLYKGAQMLYAGQSVLKQNNTRYDVTFDCEKRTASGKDVYEQLELPLNGEGYSIFSGFAEDGKDLSLRVKGLFRDYDLVLSADFCAAMKKLATDCNAASLATQPFMQSENKDVKAR